MYFKHRVCCRRYKQWHVCFLLSTTSECTESARVQISESEAFESILWQLKLRKPTSWHYLSDMDQASVRFRCRDLHTRFVAGEGIRFSRRSVVARCFSNGSLAAADSSNSCQTFNASTEEVIVQT